MKNYFAKAFLPLLILGCFFPLFSYAQVAPTGLPCNPDIVPAYIYPNQIAPATCTTSPQVAGDILHLKWDLQGTYQYPDCHITCNNELPGLNMYPCRSFNPAVTGSFLNDSRLANYTYNISNRDSNNFLSATGTKQDLKAKDDVYIRGALAGDDYQVTCREKDKPDAEAKVKTSVLARVVAGKGSGGGEPCEAWFIDIRNNLWSDTVKPFVVTETDFKSWTATDTLDSSFYGRGSGDKQDLADAIQFTQESHCTGFCGTDVKETDETTIEKLHKTLGSKKPVNFLLIKQASFMGGSKWFHAVAGLSIEKEEFRPTTTINNLTISSGKNFYLNILDPNIPGPSILKCESNYTVYDEVKKFFVIENVTTGNNFICQYSPSLNSATTQEVTLNITDVNIGNVEKLFNTRSQFCHDHLNANNKVFCQRDTGAYLKNNYPDIRNNLPQFGEGCCAGWTDFVLKVGYLGDFSGYDYHPKDGKTVGKDCDANHYPLPTKSSSADFWLANIWSAWQGFFK